MVLENAFEHRVVSAGSWKSEEAYQDGEGLRGTGGHQWHLIYCPAPTGSLISAVAQVRSV